MSILDSKKLLQGEQQVVVEATGRLHLGFVDLHGGMGRRFGSLGLALDWPRIEVVARPAGKSSFEGMHCDRAERLISALRESIEFPEIALKLDGEAPLHEGLGVGTQLALAVSMAAAKLHHLELSARQAGQLLDRGAPSGIGLGTFEHGGFVVDGGRGTDGALPPVISRLPFPSHWRVILVMDHGARAQLSGAEYELMRKLPPFPPALADRLCRELMMRALPALAEQDLENFGRAISEIQRCVGDYFAPVQGGRYVSPRVAKVLEKFESMGVPCLGQSGWGPTGFAIVDSETVAHMLVRAGREVLVGAGWLCELKVVSGINHGAHITAGWQPRIVDRDDAHDD